MCFWAVAPGRVDAVQTATPLFVAYQRRQQYISLSSVHLGFLISTIRLRNYQSLLSVRRSFTKHTNSLHVACVNWVAMSSTNSRLPLFTKVKSLLRNATSSLRMKSSRRPTRLTTPVQCVSPIHARSADSVTTEPFPDFIDYDQTTAPVQMPTASGGPRTRTYVIGNLGAGSPGPTIRSDSSGTSLPSAVAPPSRSSTSHFRLRRQPGMSNLASHRTTVDAEEAIPHPIDSDMVNIPRNPNVNQVSRTPAAANAARLRQPVIPPRVSSQHLEHAPSDNLADDARAPDDPTVRPTTYATNLALPQFPNPAQQNPRTVRPLLPLRHPRGIAVEGVEWQMDDLTNALNELVLDHQIHETNTTILTRSLAIRERQVQQLRDHLQAAEAEVERLHQRHHN